MKRVYAMLSIVALWAVMGIGTMAGASSAPYTPIAVLVGAVIPVRLMDGISSDQNSAGQMFRATLDAPVVRHGQMVFPRGTNAWVQLVRVRSGGKVKERSELQLQLTSIDSGGLRYPVRSQVVSFRGSRQGRRTARSAGIGAAVGGGLGAIFGGGSGAALGAGLGAGTGVATRAVQGSKPVYVVPESRVNFRLSAPIHMAG